MAPAVDGSRDEPCSVTTIANRITRAVAGFPELWIVGELRDLRPYGTRCFGAITDGAASLPLVVPPIVTRACPFDLEDGLEVVVRARAVFDKTRGSLRLEVLEIEPRDIGALQLAFEQLRKRLEAEGLFAPERKRPLPRYATRFGVVTSARGAVIHDIHDTLEQRWPGYDLVLWSVPVQGDEAAEKIAQAIRRFPEVCPDRQVLLVGRGGGSAEDLAAFNDERVVRAIAACPIPVISCVGHETDITLADLAADRRAATPTQAAQIATPIDRAQVEARLEEAHERAARALSNRARSLEQRVRRLSASPVFADPGSAFEARRRRVEALEAAIPRAVERRVRDARTRWERLGALVHAVSPLGVLGRGFAVVRRLDGDEVVRDAAALDEREKVRVRLHRGSFVGEVLDREADDE